MQLQLGAGRFGAPHGLLVLGGEVGKELGHLVAIGLQQRLGSGAVGGGAPGFELLGHEDVVLPGGLELAQPMASDIVRALVVLLHEGACLAVEVIGVVSQPLFEVRVSAGLGKAGNKLVGFGGSIRTPRGARELPVGGHGLEAADEARLVLELRSFVGSEPQGEIRGREGFGGVGAWDCGDIGGAGGGRVAWTV